MELTPGITNTCPNVLQGASAQLFFTLINALMAAKCTFETKDQYPPDYAKNLHDGDEFDFIIVGAGSAGSVVASRLSEIGKWRILLIEAGGYPSVASEMPYSVFTLTGTEEDWKYTAEPSEKYSNGLRDKLSPCPRGKGLGGSSLINTMVYLRSTRNDHNHWVQAGSEGWDYDSVAKHYERFENVQTNEAFYGKTGELKISRYEPDKAVINSITKAYKEQGYDEYTEEKPLGYNSGLWTSYEGTRQSAAKAFLTKTKNRKNLFLVLNAEVAKLTFNKEKTAVTGVEVKINGQVKKIRARNEVILSAGSINSPKILLNSGIGPRQHLDALGINVLQNLPVGENLQDHVAFLGYLVDVNSAPDMQEQAQSTLVDNMYQYFMHRQGPLSSSRTTSMGYINTNNNSNYANVQFQYLAFDQGNAGVLPTLLNYMALPETIIKTVLEHNKKTPTLMVLIVALNTKSKGHLKLRNKDPFSQPKIVPNYFSDENNEDLKTLIKAIKATHALLKTKSLSPYDLELIDMEVPNCSGKTPNSDSYWECAVRSLSSTLYHPVGTCKMGPVGNPSAVVDTRLRVHGVNGLRVIDGSIMPIITSCNTNAPIIMIGEKGASMVKQDWSNTSSSQES